jgi:hypothetical protein
VGLELINETSKLYDQGNVYVGDTDQHTSAESYSELRCSNSLQCYQCPSPSFIRKSFFFMPKDNNREEWNYSQTATSNNFVWPWSNEFISGPAANSGSPCIFVYVTNGSTNNFYHFNLIIYSEIIGTIGQPSSSPSISNKNDLNDIYTEYNMLRLKQAEH